jgi:hypothetical protein
VKRSKKLRKRRRGICENTGIKYLLHGLMAWP